MPVDGPTLRAVIFDVDGTLADTERDGHRPAFNAAFAEHGLDIVWGPQEYGRLLEITGGQRRIAADLRDRGYGERAEMLADAVHATKTRLFRDRVEGSTIAARPGVSELVTSLVEARIRLAVATTGRRVWVDPLVGRLLGSHVVDVMVTGDDVSRLKPDPEVYLRTLDRLGLTAADALAVEDSAVGLAAARTAGLATVVVTNGYTTGQDFAGAAVVQPAFDRPEPLLADRIAAIHHRWWAHQAALRSSQL